MTVKVFSAPQNCTLLIQRVDQCPAYRGGAADGDIHAESQLQAWMGEAGNFIVVRVGSETVRVVETLDMQRRTHME